jgi:nucleoside-diphosphate-sugar epimerase
MSLFLISGVNGFIGSHVAERLLNEGHRVRGLVRQTSNLEFIRGLDIELFFGDITDRGSLDAALHGVDVVVHVAGLASDWGKYERFFAVNVIGTQNIAEAAARNGVKRFVHMSTAAAHGFRGYRNVDETLPFGDTPFPYCKTKQIAEQWLFDFARSTGMEVTAIRPGNVFGPRDHTFIEKYLDALIAGKIAYIDRGEHWTCPVYVENLVDGIMRACFEPAAAGEAFLITDGLEITWKEFTERFADLLGVKRPRLSVPYRVAYALAFFLEAAYKLFRISASPLLTRYRISNGGRDYHFSIEKAKRLLKYEPSVGFDGAVQRTVKWYLERKNKHAGRTS